MGLVYLFLLVVEICVICRIEKQMWGSYFTPAVCLSVPTTIIIILAVIYSNCTPLMKNFYLPSLIVWIVGFALFMIPSFMARASLKSNGAIPQGVYRYKSDDFYVIITAIALAIGLFNLMRIRGAINSTMLTLGSDELSEELEATGLLAHIGLLRNALFPYFMLKADRKHKMAFVVIAISLISMFAGASKSWIIIPLFAGYLLRIIAGKTKFSLRALFVIVLSGVAVFFLSYTLIMVITGKIEFSERFFIFVGNHFSVYLLGSVESFSIDYQQGIVEPEMTVSLFAPIVNLWEVLTDSGPFVEHLNPVFLSIGEIGETNVRGGLGTIMCYSQDWLVYVIVVLLGGLYNYFIMLLSKVRQDIFTTSAYIYNLAFLAFSFFDFYWLNLAAYELPIVCLVFGLFFSKNNRIGKYA